MTTNKRHLIATLVIIVVVGIAYFLGTQKSNLSTPAVTQTSNQITNPDQEAVGNLVKNFYKALEAQDGKLLFSYFTPPTTDQEKTDLNWLTGADLVGNPEYRVFIRTKISSPKTDVTEKINDATFQVKITDQFQGLSNSGEIVGWSSPTSRYVVITMIKLDNKWLIDKFTEPSNTSNAGNAGTSKYNGFGQ